MGCCHPIKDSEIEGSKNPSFKKSETFKLSRGDFVKINNSPITQNYVIQNLLGAGGYAEVKKAIHKASNTVRAIKSVITTDCNKDEIEKLMKEVSILKKLDHQNVIRIYEVYKNKTHLYIVTELCTGGELFDRIQKIKKFSENQAAKYMLDIVSAVMHCHQRGIVHRDLKPENILFEDNTENAKLKLIDFGTSQYLQRNHKMKKTIGTYYYMAPEVISGNYDEKCDIWSLGVILYILLSGSPPFSGKTDEEITSKIRNSPLVFSSPAWTSVSQEAKTLIIKMLKKKPDSRISIEEVFNDPWLQTRGNNRVPDIELAESSLLSLASFKTETNLQKAVHSYIVSQMLDSEFFLKLRDVFSDIDKNGDGLLSAEELESAVEKFKFNLDIKEIIDCCNKSKNGVINYTEFLSATVNKAKAYSYERLSQVFQIFDKNHDGKLSLDELKHALGGENKHDRVFLNMIKEADTNGDGEIDLKEFIDHMETKYF